MNDPTVQVVCLLRFDDEHRLTAAQAKTIELAIKEALHTALPFHRRTGLWVHRASEWEWNPTARPAPPESIRALNETRIRVFAHLSERARYPAQWRTMYEGQRRRTVL